MNKDEKIKYGNKDFVLWLFYSNKQYIRSLFFVILIFYPAFGILDYYATNTSFKTILFIRLFIGLPTLIIALSLSYINRMQIYLRTINSTALFIINLSISLMYYHLTSDENAFNTFYSGLIITTASLSLSMGNIRLSNTFIIISTFTFIAVGIFKHNLFTYNKLLFIESSTFLITSAGFWIFANTIIDGFSKKLFQTQRKICLERDNISTQKEKFEKLNTTKDQFFSIISHDLRSPFNTLIGYFSILTQNKEENFTVKRTEILRIYFHIRRTYNLLNNILIWGRSQLRNNYFQPQTYIIKDILFENKDLLKEIALSKNINLTYNCDDYEFVFCDKEMIGTIVRNLVLNAIKFTKTGGNITIIARKHSPKEIEIAVIDTGIGISSTIKNKILKAAEQYTTPGTENEEGSGIGLMICQEFLNLHQRELKIESKLNNGSKFYFYLPSNKNSFKNIPKLPNKQP